MLKGETVKAYLDVMQCYIEQSKPLTQGLCASLSNLDRAFETVDQSVVEHLALAIEADLRGHMWFYELFCSWYDISTSPKHQRALKKLRLKWIELAKEYYGAGDSLPPIKRLLTDEIIKKIALE